MSALRVLAFLAVLVGLALGLSHCGGEETTGPDPGPSIPTETRSGTVSLPQGSTVTEGDLEVITFSDSSGVDANGDFSVSAPAATNLQVLFLRSQSTHDPVLIALHDPETGALNADETSTALALLLFNPYLVYTDQSQRSEYLAAAQQSPRFQDLVNALREAHAADAEKTLDYQQNPEVYEIAVQIMKETMETLSKGGQFESGVASEPPSIGDIPGSKIKFVNPRHVWYAAGIYPDAGSLREVVDIHRTKTWKTFEWGWPPVVTTEPVETEYSLGDGYFEVYMAKGLDFTKILEWNDPTGRATLYNTGEGILYFVGLLVGFAPTPNLATLPDHLHISSEHAAQLATDVVENDTEGLLMHLAQVLADNSDEIALWIWEETQSEGAHAFLESAAGIVENFALVLKVLGFVNEEGPFFWDLIFAQPSATYFVTQSGGVITSMQEENPPTAEFTVNPPSGTTSTTFHFDASGCSDDEDPVSALEVRWDWESDGVWDLPTSGYTTTKTADHQYSTTGTKTITLEVKDTGGLTDQTTRQVEVDGDGPLEMVLVPAGTFTMGDGVAYCGTDEHQVTLTHSFYLGQYEVTNQQYLEAVQWAYGNEYVNATSSSVTDNLDGMTVELLNLDNEYCEIQFSGGLFSLREAPSTYAQNAYPDGYDPAHHPVKKVSWYGAVRYCDWLSMREGLPRAYEHSGEWSCNGGDPYGAQGYRLPTDAEWEYAAQYDDERIYPWGDESPNSGRANYGFDVDWTTPAGSYPAAPASLELYDMAGNLWEWCNDWFTCSLGTSSQTDPTGPGLGSKRVLRGSSWYHGGNSLRCADRINALYPSNTSHTDGFRCVRSQ